jgi:hypothetical protein
MKPSMMKPVGLGEGGERPGLRADVAEPDLRALRERGRGEAAGGQQGRSRRST